MKDFRTIMPIRRNDAPEGNTYREYKHLLREDFHQRCGYCGDHDYFRETFYEVDHFVPKQLATERENDYSNLVYSCRSCNNSKRAKWPTGDTSKPNNGKEGWIDPVEQAYASQFDRLVDGSIFPKTDLGHWMWKALTLGNPIHRLKWTLEQLRIELKITDSLDISDLVELRRIKDLNALYRSFEEQLRGFPNFG